MLWVCLCVFCVCVCVREGGLFSQGNTAHYPKPAVHLESGRECSVTNSEHLIIMHVYKGKYEVQQLQSSLFMGLSDVCTQHCCVLDTVGVHQSPEMWSI